MLGAEVATVLDGVIGTAKLCIRDAMLDAGLASLPSNSLRLSCDTWRNHDR